MARSLMLVAVLTVPTTVWAGDGIVVPWEEFKALYRQSIERELLPKAAELPKVPQVISIDEAQYKIAVDATGAQGELALSGKIVSGDPAPIAILDKDVAVSEVREVTGGALIGVAETGCLALLPEPGAKAYGLSVAFLLRPQDENGAHILSFAVPASARTSLALTLPQGARLVDEPGIRDANGVYRLTTQERLSVKYLDSQQASAAAATTIETDDMTRVRVEKKRLLLATSFRPVRPLPGAVILRAPDGAQLLASSLKSSQITKVENSDGRYSLSFPANDRTPFTVEFAIEGWADKGEVVFTLPCIEGNTGAEGRFAVDEPDDGQVSVSGEGIVTGLPAEKLDEMLRASAGRCRSFAKAATGTRIALAYKAFQAVGTPSTVLDAQELFVSFEESGNVLSVLRLDAPPELGARLTLKAVPDAEIWSLTVNGAKQSVYAGEQGVWILPLDGTTTSRVELAFLRRGQKLGLQGTLEAAMPVTGLPSRELRVGIALPERVNLLSLDGPVSPAKGDGWQAPREFLGKPHYFSRAFFRGEALSLAIAYKEPVNPAAR